MFAKSNLVHRARWMEGYHSGGVPHYIDNHNERDRLCGALWELWPNPQNRTINTVFINYSPPC